MIHTAKIRLFATSYFEEKTKMKIWGQALISRSFESVRYILSNNKGALNRIVLDYIPVGMYIAGLWCRDGSWEEIAKRKHS